MPTVLFDVNETLLDLGPARSLLAERFDGSIDASDWFAELLRLSFVSSVTDTYAPFTVLAGHALTTVATRSGHTVTTDDRTAVGDVLRTLPAHADVTAGLGTLADNGIRIAALTNSPLATARAQLDSAGIAGYFDRIMSVDMVERFKPHRSVYEAACREMGVVPPDATMVAAHDWDVAGAMTAGLTGVFVARPNQTWSPAFDQPDAVVADITEAAAWVVGDGR